MINHILANNIETPNHSSGIKQLPTQYNYILTLYYLSRLPEVDVVYATSTMNTSTCLLPRASRDLVRIFTAHDVTRTAAVITDGGWYCRHVSCLKQNRKLF